MSRATWRSCFHFIIRYSGFNIHYSAVSSEQSAVWQSAVGSPDFTLSFNIRYSGFMIQDFGKYRISNKECRMSNVEGDMAILFSLYHSIFRIQYSLFRSQQSAVSSQQSGSRQSAVGSPDFTLSFNIRYSGFRIQDFGKYRISNKECRMSRATWRS